MSEPTDPRLLRVQRELPPALWKARVQEAESQAEVLARVEAYRKEHGGKDTAAIAAVCPDEPVSTWRGRLRRYRIGGVDALVDRRLVRRPDPIDADLEAFIDGLLAVDPTLPSNRIKALVEEKKKKVIGASTVRDYLRSKGIIRRPGRPSGKDLPEPHPLAGAELLLAAEEELGAVASLTRDIQAHMEQVPSPEGEPRDTTSNRDDHGRFLSEYNKTTAKGDEVIAPKFQSVKSRRQDRDLPSMRTANSSFNALYRKSMSLVLLPVVTDSVYWSSLQHWQGDHLGPLVGVAYAASTLDKYLGELKLAGAGDAAQESVARFWMKPTLGTLEPTSGAVVLYIDATTKPIWTHDFSRCTKVAKLGGRIMPATTTLMLHSGCGTPLIYRSFNGHVHMPEEVSGLLEEFTEVAGEGTAARLVVMDREAHTVELFKTLDPKWQYIIPLRQAVTGENARFEELKEWQPYKDAGDQVRDGYLWLHDARKGEPDLRVRVVGRKRHRTGKVAWFATNTDSVGFPPTAVVDIYFQRWPAQEHVFRNANGAAGLGVHHGFGRELVTNCAVVDKMEKLDARVRRSEEVVRVAEKEGVEITRSIESQEWAIARVQARISELQNVVANTVSGVQPGGPDGEQAWSSLSTMHSWIASARERLAATTDDLRRVEEKSEGAKTLIRVAGQQREEIARKRQILTIDVELDQIMTAFKLTFLNLCNWILANYLGGKKLSLDTLIAGILTLPGERIRTPRTETIRIFRHPRDREAMRLVEQACHLLTAKRLSRDERRLIFELVDPPSTPSRRNSAKTDRR